MSIGVTAATASLIGGGLAAAGSVGGSLIGSHSASSAAAQQQKAAQAAIDEQKRQFDVAQGNLAPWMTAGTGALSQLTAGTAPGGSFVTPYSGTFTAPTLDNTNDPGYAFRLAQGEQALKRGAAAGGGAFSGGTIAALTRAGQDYASNEYGNVFNRAKTIFDTNAGNYYTGQSNAYNRIAALAGLGMNATGQANAAGTNTANNVSELLTQSGNAGAAGTLGSGTALNNGLQGAFGSLGNAVGMGGILKLLQGTSNKEPLPLPAQAPRFNLSSMITGTNYLRPADADGYSGGYNYGYNGGYS